MSQIYKVDALLSDAPSTIGVQANPPIAYWSFAPSWILSSAEVSGAVHKDSLVGGEISITKQDTYISGSYTGYQFTASPSGSYTDSSVDTLTNRARILVTNTTASASGTLSQNSAISEDDILIRMWISPPVGGNADYKSIYIYLNYSEQECSRIKLSPGKSISLEHRAFVGYPWVNAATLSSITELSDILRNGGELSILIRRDGTKLSIKFNNNNKWIMQTTDLNSGYKIKVEHIGVPYAIAVYPVTQSTATIKVKVPVPADRNPIVTSPDAVVSDFSLSAESNGTSTASISFQGEVSDIAIIDYGSYIYPPPAWPPVFADVISYSEVSTWNDYSRIGSCSGKLVVRDDCDQLRGAHGVRAVRISASDGYNYAPRCFGLAGADSAGVSVSASLPLGYGKIGYYDLLISLGQDQIVYDMVLDGYALPTAVRLLLLAAGVSPALLTLIPDPGPPPYNDSMPYWILGRGTPSSPRYLIPAGTTFLGAIQKILQDTVYTVQASYGTFVYPYMLWIDPLGQVHLDPWMPDRQAVSAIYTSSGPENPIIHQHQIINGLEITSSSHNLRSDVIVQGIDPLTYDLIHGHVSHPERVYNIGWRRSMLIRSPAISSEEVADAVLRLADQQSSQLSHTVSFTAAFDPIVYVGQTILVGSEELSGTWPYTVMQISTTIPNGISNITARSLVESVGFIGG